VTRSIEHWRALPQLRIAEAAAIAGVCPRTIEAALDQMETRTIGRIRFVTTDSFRRWLGEDVEGHAKAAVVEIKAGRWADRVMREIA